MKYEIQKISRIVDVMIDFYLSRSAKKTNFSIEEKKGKFIINVYAEQIDCNYEKIEEMKELLNVQRQREMEEYYWQLAGNDIDGEEINLIGMMVDEATVEYNCPSLEITLIRYK
ncbi:hypothetical protein [Sedimentibacter sp. MB31-C6]|uniref:hypothetical protein n=1 Tax=Sedimentibacter sp. MB31-C6 TaxID=3109366 RepID=UPI002DDCFFB4|nr:hypothetical protein [Sedimentibacter sp. MB36-C1]WSI05508.1 hypothetical protein U8307_06880 [Sedimentibacter sp. MB36-C1]